MRTRYVIQSALRRGKNTPKLQPKPVKGFRRRSALLATAFAAALLLSLTAQSARAEHPSQNPQTVLELFTSQGCSSCPPADRLAARLAKRDDLLVLSFNVNYWDYLGWKDTLASQVTTRRQRLYARAMGNWGAVYTPQMVVNGRRHVVASRPQKVRAAISRQKRNPSKQIPIHISLEKEILRVIVAADPNKRKRTSATIWLVPFSSQEQVTISRGENAGRKLSYTNVAKTITPIGMWSGDSVELELPTEEFPKNDGGFAVLLQENGYNAILGASKILR